MVLCLKFRFLIHFDLVFVEGIMSISRFFYFNYFYFACGCCFSIICWKDCLCSIILPLFFPPPPGLPLRWSPAYCPGWSAVVRSWLTATTVSPGSSNSLVSVSWVAGITGTHHHSRLIFVLLVEMGFYHVGQDSLELLTSGDSSASASQGARITGVSHHAWLISKYFFDDHKTHIFKIEVKILHQPPRWCQWHQTSSAQFVLFSDLPLNTFLIMCFSVQKFSMLSFYPSLRCEPSCTASSFHGVTHFP